MKKSKATRQPNNTIFLGISGTAHHFDLFVSLCNTEGAITLYSKKDLNRIEIAYWFKSTFDGIMADVIPTTLIEEAKMSVDEDALSETTRVMGMSLNRNEYYTGEVDKDGQLIFKLQTTGPKWMVNQEFMIHCAKKLMYSEWEEPQQVKEEIV